MKKNGAWAPKDRVCNSANANNGYRKRARVNIEDAEGVVTYIIIGNPR